MANLTSQLIVRLVDGVSRPAAAAGKALRSLGQAARTANGMGGIAGLQARLGAAMQKNAIAMANARGNLVDAIAGYYMLNRTLGSAVRTAADFETAMNQVAAVSGAAGDELEALRKQALELGRTTQFTSSQAADAMGFLAMAGFKANQILAAMPGTLQLAASAQMDMARAADVVTNILTGYGKDVSELGHVNDVLVKAFTSANTNLEQLAEAMKYAGPVASAANVQFEETAAALAIMGNAGIQASMAGTSLRGAISRILNPTKQVRTAMKQAGLSFVDAKGHLKPLVEIVKELEPHVDDAGLFMKLFGQRAGPAMAALVSQGSDELAGLTKSLEDSAGTAERIAEVQMQGFNGKMKELKSAFEGLQIAIGDALIPALSALARAMTDVLGPLTEWTREHPQLTAAILGTAGALVALRIAAAAVSFGGLLAKGSLIGIAMGFTRIASAAKLAGGVALIPFIGGFRRIAGVTQIAKLRFSLMAKAFREGSIGMAGIVQGSFATIARGIASLMNPLWLLTGAFKALKIAVIGSGIGAALVGIAMAGAWIYNNWKGIQELFAGIAEGFREAMGPALAAVQPIIDIVKKLWNGISDLVGPIKATAEQWRAWGRAIGETIGGFVRGVIELPGKIIAAFQELAGQMFAIGKQIVQNLWDGMLSLFDSLIAWVKGKADAIANALRIGGGPVGGGLAVGPVGAKPGGIGAATGAAIGAATGGAPAPRAGGGPVTRGRRYIVGERRPELFVPGQSGRILPNVPAGGGGPITFAPSFSIVGVTDAKEVARQVKQILERDVAALFRGVQGDVGLSTT